MACGVIGWRQDSWGARTRERAGSRQSVFKLFAFGCDIVRVQDGRNDANASSPGRQNLIERMEIDAADGEPWSYYVLRGPTNIFGSHRFGRGLGAGGIDRADGKVIGFGGDGASSLRWRVGAQTDDR